MERTWFGHVSPVPHCPTPAAATLALRDAVAAVAGALSTFGSTTGASATAPIVSPGSHGTSSETMVAVPRVASLRIEVALRSRDDEDGSL